MTSLQSEFTLRALRGCVLALALAGMGAAAVDAPVWAQQRPQRAEQGGPAGHAAPAAADTEASARAPRDQRQLPADSTTDQTIEVAGRTLRFKATAGSIPLNKADDGSLLAEIAYVAYVM